MKQRIIGVILLLCIVVSSLPIVAFAEECDTHSYEAVITPPTCTADGYTTYICSVCGYAYVDDVVSATGHNWLPATDSAPKTCTVCKITEGSPLLKKPIDTWKMKWSVEDQSTVELYDGLTKSIKLFLPKGVVLVGYTYECGGKAYDAIMFAGEWTVTANIALDTDNGYTEDIYELYETEFYIEITVTESEENPDDSIPEPVKDHSKCQASHIERIIITLYNFFLRFLGKPKVCPCGDKLL